MLRQQIGRGSNPSRRARRDEDHAKYFLPNGLRFETRQCELQEPGIVWTQLYACNETELNKLKKIRMQDC